MWKKQNNDELKNDRQNKTSSDKLRPMDNQNHSHSQNHTQRQDGDQSLTQGQTFKRHSKQSFSKIGSKQSPPSYLSPSLQGSLPVSIHDLDEKHLNAYLKQFMEINSFQTIQKGKQLIDLIKQAPGSKIASSVIGKCFKLFRSNIPDAVLCSFQFFRDLIEVGHWKISDAIQELLLMPMVEIIKYRAYLPQIERGNTYFLGQIMRYGQDDKTNHLVKISSTFFRMVHEVLYVWGLHYFPDSKFYKMLNKLMVSENITFPQFPQDFRFYSQPRVQLYKNLIEKNKKIYLKEETQFKTKKSQDKPSQIQKIPENNSNNQQKIAQQSKLVPKTQLNKVKDSQQTQKPKLPQNSIPLNLKSSKSTENQVKTDQKQLKIQSPKPKTPEKQKKVHQQEDSLESIRLKHEVRNQSKPIVPVTEQKKMPSPTKSVQEYKKIKPNKIKPKKSLISNKQSQKTIQMEKSRTQSFIDPENALSMIQQIQKIDIFEPKEQKYQVDSPKSVIFKHKNERTRSELISNQKIEDKKTQIVAEPTFRHAQKPYDSNKNIRESETQSNLVNHNDPQPSTVRVMSSERQRYIESVSDGSVERPNESFASTRKSQRAIVMNENTKIKDFFKNQFRDIKNSIIEGVKEDIVKIIESKINQSAHKRNQDKVMTTRHEDKKSENFNNLSNQGTDFHQKSDEQVISARFGTTPELNQPNPSIEAYEFVRKKFKSGKKLKNSSKLKRPSILSDEELIQDQKKQNFVQKKENLPQSQSLKQKIVSEYGVNTDELRQEHIFDEIQSLKQKLNLMTASLSKQSPLTPVRSDNLVQIMNQRNSFFKTPRAINKNQLQGVVQEQDKIQSLKNSINTGRKKSKSKLSQRRSSIEATLFSKAVLRPQACRSFFEETFGGPSTLLFNAAVSSVQKKGKV